MSDRMSEGGGSLAQGPESGGVPPMSSGGSPGELSRRTLFAIVTAVLLLSLGWTFRGLWSADARSEVPFSTVLAYSPSQGESAAFRFSLAMDQRFVIWVISRNARTWLSNPAALFDAEVCYPAPNSLALGEPALTLGLLGAPAFALTGDPILTFNFVVIALPLISALAMFLFVRAWTSVPAAAVVAAVIYAFHIVKISDVVHPYTADTAWTLFAFFFFRRWLQSGHWRDCLLLAASCALQIGGSLYPLIGAAAVGAPYAAACLYRIGWRRPGLRQWGVLLLLVGLALYGAMAPFLAKSVAGDLVDRAGQIFLSWTAFVPGRTGSPGVFTFILIIVACVPLGRGRSKILHEWAAARSALLVGAVLTLFLATGTNEGERFLAVVNGEPPPEPLPNLFAMLAAVVPGLSAIRAPGWIATSAHMALAALAGFGAARLLQAVPSRFSPYASAGLVLLALVFTLKPGFPDGHRFELEARRPPAQMIDFYAALEERGNSGPLLELPVTRGRRKGSSYALVGPLGLERRSVGTLLSAYHHRPTSRCYNSFLPSEVSEAWTFAREVPKPDALRALSLLGFTTLVIHHTRTDRRMNALRAEIDQGVAAGQIALEPLHSTKQASAYLLPKPPPPNP